MDELQKPATEADLPVPFVRIGESEWANGARAVLNTYGVPLPPTISNEEFDAAERRLCVELPIAYRLLVTELGLLDLDGIRFLPLSEVDWLTEFFAKSAFRPDDAAKLSGLLGIVDFLGSGDFIALDPKSGMCVRCGHDPPGFSAPLPSIDALVQYGFMSLPSSYYGWPGREIDELVDRTLQHRFGVVF